MDERFWRKYRDQGLIVVAPEHEHDDLGVQPGDLARQLGADVLAGVDRLADMVSRASASRGSPGRSGPACPAATSSSWSRCGGSSGKAADQPQPVLLPQLEHV